ncbi:response regulator transcription factor [Dinghuibacter silviterrae]|uniref:LuxR family two component transcriptional regulator n=1 Tax=Dinghuibacter silviterrae TaxID=1539049 RepID=A0A4R8DSQ1_9BACT|nr:response regulator transcription factor [Dinghuibacter silviterrae]TDX00435.1 LuxR family two component transcriptional regulator [Dinghuibacter silviterrae]
MMPIRVCIVEDNRDIRQALEQILQLSGGFEWAASYSSGEDALVGIPITVPQVVLMDIHLGGVDGIECVRILKRRYPEMLFMMCTVYEDDAKIFEALRAGASGYVLKKTTPDKLLEAIRELNEGGSPMSSQIARKVVAAFQGQGKAALPGGAYEESDRLDSLSRREMEILEMLAKGMIYKEISLSLFISPETVRKHVYHIYEKLHVNNRVEAINKFFGR